jgi:hypothetical protein
MRRSIVLSLLCLPLALSAQDRTNTVSPGMTRAQVIEALGAPTTLRTASEYTYMFYPNSCGRSCGMNDLVILRHDSVSDAIFRSPNRHYTGTSSSPEEATPEAAPRTTRPAAKPMTMPKKDATPAKPAATTQMKPPATPNDGKPSIPATQKPIPPAPAKTTAPDKKTPG